MKKIITILIGVVIMFSLSFASYTISSSNKQKIDNLSEKIYNKVEGNYESENKREYIYQTIVDSIDGYIGLNDISKKNEAILLYLKTLLIYHMGYKIGNCEELIIVD